MALAYGPRLPKVYVLCFDGTGNRFRGTEEDSNVLKFYSMLDKSQENFFHYYQPGVGTYIQSQSLTSTGGLITNLSSWWKKTKDSAIGVSFGDHVISAYLYLMQYYECHGLIYIVGFSRGSFIARFLAEMLDFVGLLSPGNEELVRFAWKTFVKWQTRDDKTEEDRKEKRKLFRFMKAFRETFSRPVRRISFLGLFDTVTSVPKFETARMERSRFPYTARSSARIVRHAVSIDERRAKFRQDLISEVKLKTPDGRRPSAGKSNGHSWHTKGDVTLPKRYRARSPARRTHNKNLAAPNARSTEDLRSLSSFVSGLSLEVPGMAANILGEITEEEEDETKQDIEELWFPGCHADIGGGWAKEGTERWMLSHSPLVWMVNEARRAGLIFNEEKMEELMCLEPQAEAENQAPIQVNITSYDDIPQEKTTEGPQGPEQEAKSKAVSFWEALHSSSTSGIIHDCLSFRSPLPKPAVLSWKLMEYLPFRRMDLQDDGSWKPIRWPLPCGEVRDIPDEARIHNSAIKRMKHDENYRPGNLIMGGGGRGVRRAPKDAGIGDWEVKGHQGDELREYYVRKPKPKEK